MYTSKPYSHNCEYSVAKELSSSLVLKLNDAIIPAILKARWRGVYSYSRCIHPMQEAPRPCFNILVFIAANKDVAMVGDDRRDRGCHLTEAEKRREAAEIYR